MTQSQRAAHERLLSQLRVTTRCAMTVAERERRHGPLPRSNAVQSVTQKGKRIPVIIDGVTYGCIKDAARMRGHAVKTIVRMVKRGEAKLI